MYLFRKPDERMEHLERRSKQTICNLASSWLVDYYISIMQLGEKPDIRKGVFTCAWGVGGQKQGGGGRFN